jgi:hypothetical protein
MIIIEMYNVLVKHYKERFYIKSAHPEYITQEEGTILLRFYEDAPKLRLHVTDKLVRTATMRDDGDSTSQIPIEFEYSHPDFLNRLDQAVKDWIDYHAEDG